MAEEREYINVYGARVHNLKNVDVEIPRDSLTVITGLSGSGKSSLAFDTIFAEGQRRYIEIWKKKPETKIRNPKIFTAQLSALTLLRIIIPTTTMRTSKPLPACWVTI